MKKQRVLIVLTLLFSIVCFSQSQRELYIQSTEAYKAKEYARFLIITKQLDHLRPSHPTYTYNLAAAYALNNEKEKAISILEKLLLMNNTIDIEKEADFDSLKSTSEFEKVIRLKSELEKPIGNSEKVISLTEKNLHPEGLIYLPKTKTWLASSIRKKKIVAFDFTTGQCSDWFTESNFSVFAMKSDAKENYLWVATAAMPEMLGFSKEMEGKAEVLKIDIRTRKIVKRFPMEGNHVFGDLILDKSGNVYVSDSGEAKIYRISNDVMSVWLDLKSEAFNLQGITFNEKQSKLYIADYLKGIVVVDVNNTHNRNWLDFPKETTVKGIDGLVFHENSLFAIHNGVKPIRVIQYTLNQNQKEISSFKIIDHNRSEFDEPALATIINATLYFFSNSPWKGYDKQFHLDETKFENPMLFQYKIR
ncbi:hypothetical protein FSS13T_16390 [Flavobacterium saliperosum S13]|uniref:SMP-30/Gluconolaconase/LRE-like region-containing protein n=2 Tax=Flavobacterium saliperosum TaxID=329186 RepID=A0A1G4VHJ1_9FLAO|nr:hypothetical protein [Flavobacterium saliperosum]ESU25406.1 hypothetical protein FSS13T_16390 [Flavobacterium saliperosum S13]SCX06904.1 hypothetical protein SAMN02927925_01079 [Flavobacterium saliperosum]